MPRHDIYSPIHKGLRLALSNLLVKLGQTDFAGEEAADTLLALRHQMMLSAGHLAHEEAFIHGALEARSPGATARLEEDHDHHRASFEAIEAAIRAVEAAAPAERPALGRALYLAFSKFVTEDFEHMAQEETETLPLLHAHFSDAELIDIEGRLIASLPPEKNIAYLNLMIPAMSRPERAGFLGFVRETAPPEAFAAVMNFAARPSLPAEELRHLERELGLAA